jgi:hypothetical protein
MTVQQAYYEEVLADCSDHLGAIALLKQHRPYLELIPSMRRSSESVISIPLPLVRICNPAVALSQSARGVPSREAIQLAADVAILMCDPEWKIKTGVEIFVFIRRPEEDFSNLLGRWRQTQVMLDKGYEWVMPDRHQQILSEGSNKLYSLFVIFPDTPTRIQRGLQGACLPFVIQTIPTLERERAETINLLSSEIGAVDDSTI